MAHFQFLVPLLSPSTKISTVVANTNLSDPILLYPSSFTVWKQAAGLIRYDTISQKGPMMNTQTTRPIGIKTTYTIDGTDGTTTTTSETFDASRSDACEVRVGLPVDIEPVKVRYISKYTSYAENVENAIIFSIVFGPCSVVAPANRN